LITIQTEIEISAPIEICFDAARDIERHTKTVWKHTKEKAIISDTGNLLELNHFVTFEATHFFIRQKLISKIVEYNRPYRFVDEMQKGVFKSLKHIHEFNYSNGKTVMTDTLIFEAPLGILGRVVEEIILKNYMRKFLEARNAQLKKGIENNMITIRNAREIPDQKDRVIEYFWSKWGGKSNYLFYKDCIERSLDTDSDLPRFFVALQGEEIIGSYAILRSDLNSRQDLFPWLACLFVEKKYRGQNLGIVLQNHAKQYMKTLGYEKLYLCTEIDGYYEKNEWVEIGTGYSIGDDQYKIYEACLTSQ